MKKFFVAAFLLSSIVTQAIRIDATKAGIVPDGKTLNTAAIQKSISLIEKSGGGTLYFPAGKYLTGAMHLCSNLTIETEAGTEIIFSDNFDDYLPYIDMRFEGIMMKSFSPLLYAKGKENITITGRGTFNGNGTKWWRTVEKIHALAKEGEIKDLNKYQKMWEAQNDQKSLYADNDSTYYQTLRRKFFRPPFLQFQHCKNIVIEHVKFIDSPFWTINPEFCQNIIVDGITIINNPDSPNTDGINPESCQDVRISNCFLSVGDDCVTIKSGRDAQARRINVPCENITVTNCVMHAGHGGVVIGSEMSGGVRNVTISNCVFDGTDRGIRLKTRRGRGATIEAVSVSNIVMRNIQKSAIHIDMVYEKPTGDMTFNAEITPTIRNLSISNVTGYNVAQPIYLRGLKESPIDDVSFSNISLTSSKENFFEFVSNIRINQVYLNGVEQKSPTTK